jgi:hypothetical protein
LATLTQGQEGGFKKSQVGIQALATSDEETGKGGGTSDEETGKGGRTSLANKASCTVQSIRKKYVRQFFVDFL